MDAYEKSRIICGSREAGSKKDTDVLTIQREFALQFSNSPDYCPDTKVNDAVQPLLVSKNKSVITQKRIIAYPGQTFYRGDVVDCYRCKWLIIDVDANREIYTRGVMQQCQQEIKWQDVETGVIYARWATMEKPYFSNLEEENQISVSTREFKVQMRYDAETSKIDIGKRLMLEIIDGKPKTYRITSVDSMTERYVQDDEITGFVVINIEQDAYKPETDNQELMICDYIDPATIKTDDHSGESGWKTNHMVITYMGSAELRAGGAEKVINAEMFDPDGNKLAMKDTVWTVDSQIPAAQYVFSYTEGKATIRIVEDDVALVGKKIKLTVSGYGLSDAVEIEVIG